jgi:dTDP-4-amino-4,6-dideoxygalactose transaminase
MTELPLLPQASPHASYLAQKPEIDAAIARVLASGRYILGDEVRAFESEFAAYLGVGFAVGVANGTDAIEVSLRALGIGPGHAVLAPSHTAVATIAAIERAGARPVLIDVANANAYTIGVAGVEAALSQHRDFEGCRPAAVIAVHLYGGPVEMPEVVDVARRHGVWVIEDCAQSHGARLAGRQTGTFGDVATFSFYPTKNLGAFGDGGLIATRDPQLAERIRALRAYGWTRPVISEFPGVNSRLDEIQAAILRAKLPRLESDNPRRRQIAHRYAVTFAALGIGVPRVSPDVEHAYHQFVIRTPNRDGLQAFLEKTGIGSAIHYPVPVHRQPAYRDRRLTAGALPFTESLCDEILSLPIYPQLTDVEVERVIAAVCEWRHANRELPTGATSGSPLP